MAKTGRKNQSSTAERLVSKTNEEIIKEAKRVGEGTLYSAKAHFEAARLWHNFHFWIGIPIVIIAAVVSASALSQFDIKYIVAGGGSIVIAVLSAINTFIDPNKRRSDHFNAGNDYDALHNKVRIFWSIDCWKDESEQVLTERLNYFSEQKSSLNKSCPQIPWLAYRRAKEGIESGQGEYEVDKMDCDRYR